MIVYGLKNCDTCRKAVKALGADLHDVRETPVTRDQLGSWYAAFGAALVNTRSTTWRGLDEAARASADTSEGAVALLLAHPTLIKRPVIEKAGAVHLGWTRAVQDALS